MRFGKLEPLSIQDGPGVRVSIYVSGCRNNCLGCHNKEAQDFNFGKEYTKETEDRIIELMTPDYVEGLSILGGEPFEEENQVVLVNLIKRVKELFPNKSIWFFTGYELNDLTVGGRKRTSVTEDILLNTDVLVVGRFILSQRDISDDNRWRGSRNQRIIDVKKSLRTDNRIVYLENIPNNN